ncbi:MAG: hypothetical protein WCP06_06480 [Verrucomicrobiota bacterium]
MSHDEETISKLLRLKRHELPPPDYFENFLKEFHHRQRVELLRRPLWRIALDRAQDFFGSMTLTQFSYATASVAVLAVAGVSIANILQHPGGVPSHSVLVASARPASAMEQVAQPVRMVSAQPAYASHEFSLDPQIRFPDTFQAGTNQPRATSLHPRYILDARPVSYEPPFSF